MNFKERRHYAFTGWPRKRIDRIPLSVLETGYDIAGFWVARMVTVCHRFSFCETLENRNLKILLLFFLSLPLLPI